MKKPNLMTKYELTTPVSFALTRLENIRQRKAMNEDKIILEGLFVLAVASFENSLNDTLKIILSHFPEKLDNKIENICKQDIIEGDPLQKAIQNKLLSISYKNVMELIDYFVKMSGINKNSMPEDSIYRLQEIKARRNLLIHNNLKINQIYIDTAGQYKESTQLDLKIEIDQSYLLNSLLILNELLSSIKTNLLDKYCNYTQVNAIKNLWNFMFPSPIIIFENEWVINSEADCLISYNQQKSLFSNFSGSEKFLFSLWLSHFNNDKLKTGDLNFYNLSPTTREKLSYFIEVADILRVNGLLRKKILIHDISF